MLALLCAPYSIHRQVIHAYTYIPTLQVLAYIFT